MVEDPLVCQDVYGIPRTLVNDGQAMDFVLHKHADGHIQAVQVGHNR